jgi:hypothetical protein
MEEKSIADVEEKDNADDVVGNGEDDDSLESFSDSDFGGIFH